MKYKKIPVEIEAWIWDGSVAILEKLVNMAEAKIVMTADHKELKITTLEGVMTANLGDYIIKGVKGEFYPCKPDIFKLTYEKVE